MSLSESPYRSVIITSIRQETPGVKTFAVSYDDGSNIPYVSGQFITFVFMHHGKEERRSFSISSSHVLDEQLSFTVKRIDNGIYSRFLNDKASVGDTLYTTGAAGLFTLPAKMQEYQQVFFFAAGIGMTPVMSLIKALLHTQPKMQAVLIYSNRSQEEVVFYNELVKLSEQYTDRFRLEFLYSTNFDLARARLSKALIPVLLKEYSTAPKQKTLCYICGPYDYMRMTIWTLEEQGIPKEQIRKENFNVSERVVTIPQPVVAESHKVTIMHNGKVDTFMCQYPDTILQAAKKNHIALPYSCEVGRCGSCAAICKSGKVWLSYNEVLMDMDLAHGSILTCTGHPIGGDVVIEV